MSTQLNLTITAETAADALKELAQISIRAAKELGVGPQPADIQPELPLARPAAASTKDNGAGAPASDDGAAAGEKRAGRKKAAVAPAPETAPDRAEIVDGLTKLYMAGDPAVRERITTFRDGYNVQRLRELKDDALPEAAKLLAALRQVSPEP